MHYQQFDYSTSGTDNELFEVKLPIPPLLVDANPVESEAPGPSDHSISPTRYIPQLFSDHQPARSPSTQLTATEKEPSLLGTSAPLLTNPSFTEFLSNYPIWPTDTQPRPASKGTDSDDPSPAPTIPSVLSGAGTTPSLKRGGNHPNREKSDWFSRRRERGKRRQ